MLGATVLTDELIVDCTRWAIKSNANERKWKGMKSSASVCTAIFSEVARGTPDRSFADQSRAFLGA